MLAPGDPAPDFDLPGTTADGETGTYRLTAATRAGPVVLCFYPFDFGPASARALRAIQATDWSEVTDGLAAFGVSPDGPHAHRAFAEAADLAFPLLVDRTGAVAGQFDAREGGDRPGQPLVRLSAFVVDRDCRIAYTWGAGEPDDTPDVEALRAAVGDVATAGDR